MIDGPGGRHGKYKTATVFLVPVTDTPSMTPFFSNCHIIRYTAFVVSFHFSCFFMDIISGKVVDKFAKLGKGDRK